MHCAPTRRRNPNFILLGCCVLFYLGLTEEGEATKPPWWLKASLVHTAQATAPHPQWLQGVNTVLEGRRVASGRGTGRKGQVPLLSKYFQALVSTS